MLCGFLLGMVVVNVLSVFFVVGFRWLGIVMIILVSRLLVFLLVLMLCFLMCSMCLEGVFVVIWSFIGGLLRVGILMVVLRVVFVKVMGMLTCRLSLFCLKIGCLCIVIVSIRLLVLLLLGLGEFLFFRWIF